MLRSAVSSSLDPPRLDPGVGAFSVRRSTTLLDLPFLALFLFYASNSQCGTVFEHSDQGTRCWLDETAENSLKSSTSIIHEQDTRLVEAIFKRQERL